MLSLTLQLSQPFSSSLSFMASTRAFSIYHHPIDVGVPSTETVVPHPIGFSSFLQVQCSSWEDPVRPEKLKGHLLAFPLVLSTLTVIVQNTFLAHGGLKIDFLGLLKHHKDNSACWCRNLVESVVDSITTSPRQIKFVWWRSGLLIFKKILWPWADNSWADNLWAADQWAPRADNSWADNPRAADQWAPWADVLWVDNQWPDEPWADNPRACEHKEQLGGAGSFFGQNPPTLKSAIWVYLEKLVPQFTWLNYEYKSF